MTGPVVTVVITLAVGRWGSCSVHVAHPCGSTESWLGLSPTGVAVRMAQVIRDCPGVSIQSRVEIE